MDKPDWDTTISGDVIAWCPECAARLKSAGYEHTLECPSCGTFYDGDQPDQLGEQPAQDVRQEAQKILRKFEMLASQLEYEAVEPAIGILEHEDWSDLALQVANLKTTIGNLRYEDRYTTGD